MKKTKPKCTHTCDWCRREGKKVKAQWRTFTDYACDKHKDKLPVDDGYMSEADHQTWGRL